MSNKPARRELGFVLAVACAGLVAVLVVAFAPWYPAEHAPSAGSGIEQQIVRLIGGGDGSTTLTR
ncbi:hypothetical protein [Paractinoplanes rishiriensis]|uniref:Uncharacterized protein n=1 Tax=Paractinoplanes rishiriensis TaxID=1050105 RepID=A0A919N003_9ACTN|nr:hypothetical protein [Actinoplanes rishiriensis]GIE98990.1 hypothetical protein Ari01nite_64550 [Actinoplanes rishiriensis]